MLEAIYQLGKYYIEKNHLDLNNTDDLLKIIIENPDSTGNYNNTIVLKFDENYKFINVEIEDLKKECTELYLYRQGSSRGTDFTPSARVGKEIKGTFENKILKWFLKDKKGKYVNKIDVNKIFNKLYIELDTNKQRILYELEQIIKNKDKKESLFLTIKIGNNYLFNIPEFKQEFIKDYLISLKNKHEAESYSENHRCFLCHEQKEVYGFTVPYAFYSFNNPGFVTGGSFSQKDAYKNLPICSDCSFALEAGKKVIENEITPKDTTYFRLPGFKYLIIPKFIDNKIDNIKETIEFMLENFTESDDFINSAQNQIDNEQLIINILKECENYANFNFMIFDDTNNAEYKILLFIEDVFPSRLNKLAEAKQDIESNKYFQSFKIGKDKYIDLTMSFRLIYNLLDVKKENKVSKNKEKYYLEIINSIFTNKKINYETLLEEIMDKISLAFINKRSYDKTALEAFMFLNYLKKLDLLDNFCEDKTMETQTITEKTELREKIESLFSEFSGFYGCSARQVCFLTGVLVKKLLNNQYQMNRTQPFRKELNRFKLNESSIKEIFRKAVEKLESYKRNYYKDLEEIIIDYYQKAGEGWKISDKDISFFFVAGMTKANSIIPPKKGYEKEAVEEVVEETSEGEDNE